MEKILHFWRKKKKNRKMCTFFPLFFVSISILFQFRVFVIERKMTSKWAINLKSNETKNSNPTAKLGKIKSISKWSLKRTHKTNSISFISLCSSRSLCAHYCVWWVCVRVHVRSGLHASDHNTHTHTSTHWCTMKTHLRPSIFKSITIFFISTGMEQLHQFVFILTFATSCM